MGGEQAGIVLSILENEKRIRDKKEKKPPVQQLPRMIYSSDDTGGRGRFQEAHRRPVRA